MYFDVDIILLAFCKKICCPLPHCGCAGIVNCLLAFFTYLVMNSALNTDGKLKDASQILWYNSEGDNIPIPGPPPSSEGGFTAAPSEVDSADSLPSAIPATVTKRKKHTLSIEPALQVAGKRI
jgi:hypothetical protein